TRWPRDWSSDVCSSDLTAGSSNPINTAIMPITTSSSSRVKPRRPLCLMNRGMVTPISVDGGDGLRSAVRLGLPQALVPDLDFTFVLVAAACGEALAVRAERHAPDRAEAAVEGLDRLPGPCIPDDHLPPTR